MCKLGENNRDTKQHPGQGNDWVSREGVAPSSQVATVNLNKKNTSQIIVGGALFFFMDSKMKKVDVKVITACHYR